MLMKKFGRLALGAAALCGATLASAATVTLDFEGLKDGESVLGFYGGGAGSAGSVGTNYGITFDSNTRALIDSDVPGGTGSFANEPSGSTALFFTRGSVILNVEQGFTDLFSFFYSTVAATGVVRLYDGLNATGTLIGEISIRALGPTCVGDPTGDFCNWSLGALNFAGTAHSIDFGGIANQIAYDNVTFGNLNIGGGPDPTPTPEPESLALVGAALLALRLTRRRA